MAGKHICPVYLIEEDTKMRRNFKDTYALIYCVWVDCDNQPLQLVNIDRQQSYYNITN